MTFCLSELLIVGCARNCEKFLDESVGNMLKAFENAKKLHFLIIESDSEDGTLQRLASLSTTVANFEYLSLGKLEDRFPLRTDRIAYCRNAYLKEFRDNPKYHDCSYLVVADLDGVNDLLDQPAIESCFSVEAWDVCTANQRGPYYDIWALRHPVWSPNDCWEHFYFLLSNGEVRDEALFAAIYSKMIEISTDHEWIKVDSAFGGLGIYKRAILGNAEYSGNLNGKRISEHVPFHDQINKNGGKIYINPRLINSTYTEHSGLIPLRKPGPMKSRDEVLTVAYHDIVAAYKIFLNRMPESIAVIEDRIGISTEKLLIDFLTSDEFGLRESIDPILRVLGTRAVIRLNNKALQLKK